MSQMERAEKIASSKYPTNSGLKQVWIFDQSSYHTAMAEDALDASIYIG